jgi:hypothetical protein
MGDEMQMFGWDDIGVAAEEASFEALPEGEYAFEVRNIKTETYQKKNQQSNIPDGCKCANVQLYCTNDKAKGTVFEKLYLYTSGLGRITSFFKACGMLPPDFAEGQQMPAGFKTMFDQSVTRTGRCKVTVRTYKDKDNNDRKSNNVRFIMPEVGVNPSYPTQAPTPPVQYQAPAPQYATPTQPTPPQYQAPAAPAQYTPPAPPQQPAQQGWGAWG